MKEAKSLMKKGILSPIPNPDEAPCKGDTRSLKCV